MRTINDAGEEDEYNAHIIDETYNLNEEVIAVGVKSLA